MDRHHAIFSGRCFFAAGQCLGLGIVGKRRQLAEFGHAEAEIAQGVDGVASGDVLVVLYTGRPFGKI